MRLHHMARVVVGVLALAVFAAGPAAAQRELAPGAGFDNVPRIGIGYVANAPNIFGGVSAWGLTDLLGGLGLYVDAKFSLDTPASEPDFVDSLTVAQVEALPEQTRSRDGFGWWSVNAALIRPLSPELMFYLGAGYTYEDLYYRYADPQQITGLGQLGWYWIHDETQSGGRLNVMGGAFFRMSEHVALQVGLESAPQGFSVGASYSFGI